MSAPTNSFFFTDGNMPPDAKSYVERQADQDLFDGLRQGEFCYVLTASQMGKSSLMVRTAKRLRDSGANVIVVDLTNIGTNVTVDQWYCGLVTSLGRPLRLEDEVDDFWFTQERLGPVQRMTAVLRDIILPELKRRAAKNSAAVPGVAGESGATTLADPANARIVVFVDEINAVRGLPFSADDFFTAIEFCYRHRAEDPEFNRLTFCLVGIATPSDLIRDTRTTTPFNIGRRVELTDLKLENASVLIPGFVGPAGQPTRSPEEAQQLLERIFYWTNGQPYLTQRLCRSVAPNPDLHEPSQVDQLCEEAFFCARAREQDPNLLSVRERLLGADALLGDVLKLYIRIWRGEAVPDDETSRVVDILRLSGIVRLERGLLVVRNRIYHRVFDEGWATANLPAERQAEPGSIAVLPFRIIGKEAGFEYLADGLTDELISALGRVPGLRVASRTSVFEFKHQPENVRKIGRQLVVQNVVEGSLRPVDLGVQISASLVQAADGHCIWSESYRYSHQELVAIESKIVNDIVVKLRTEVGLKARPVATGRRFENTEAYNLYLKGRFAWNKRTESAVRRSIELFEQAIQKDPTCAPAYAGLADAFNILGTYNYAPPLEAYPKARAAASQALGLDENLAQAHCALGCTSSVHDWDWPRAETAFQTAISLNPSYATAHHWYAINCLGPLGRHEEALGELRQAQEVDPLSISITASIGLALYLAGRHGEAIEQCRQAVEMDSSFWIGQIFLGWACIQKEQFDEAVEALKASLTFGNKDPVALAALAHAYGVMNRRAEALDLLRELEALRQTRYVPAMDLVPVHLALNDTDAAWRWLDTAVQERSFKLIYLNVDPRLQALRNDSRFSVLARRIGLEKTDPE